MRIIYVVVVGLLLALCVDARQKGPRTWDNRINSSQRTRLCKGETGADSWGDRGGYTRCTTCASRCYVTTFNATAETSGFPFGLCSTAGDECTISVFLTTAPCCRCEQGHAENDVLEEDIEEIFELTATESYCEVPSMRVFVNGWWTLPLEENCNLTSNAKFQQEVVLDDCTVNTITDCKWFGGYSVDSENVACSGAALTQAYNSDYRNGHYPDPCFADKHWVESYTSDEKGLISSEFKLYRPNSAALWFDKVLSRSEAPRRINCGQVPTSAPTYVVPI